MWQLNPERLDNMSLIDPSPEFAVPQFAEYLNLKADHRRIWIRVQKAAERGKGVRLTAHEVSVLAETDFREDPANSDG
jgi:hypothetical protein